MCRFEPSYLAVTICKDYEISAKGHRVPHDKKRLDSGYCNRGQKCKERHELQYIYMILPYLFRKSQPFSSENQPLISKIIPTI